MHYIRYGAKEGYDPHPLFDVQYYLSQAPCLCGADPVTHYVKQGRKDGLKPNKRFDASLYLEQISDFRESGNKSAGGFLCRSKTVTPAAHPLPEYNCTDADYALLQESDLFDAEWYLGKYTDVARAKFDPIRHYLTNGAIEGRDPGPKSLVLFQLNENASLTSTAPLKATHKSASGVQVELRT